jgi:hypothetical protein
MHDAFKGCVAEMCFAMRSVSCRVQPNTAEGKLHDLIETPKVNFGTKIERPLLIVKCQPGLRNIYFRGISK